MQADLRSTLRSRITYAWVLAAAFIQVVRVLGSTAAGTASEVVSAGLSDFVYIWALVIIGLAASSVSSEAGELADSILSKSVTRADYVLAKFTARIAYTLITFSVVAAVLLGAELRLTAGGFSVVGLASAVLLVALAMVMLTTLGVGFSVAMPSTVSAIVALLVLWYSMTVLFPVAGLGFLSPGNLLGRLPGISDGAWGRGEWDLTAGFAVVSAASTALSSAYFHLKDI